MACSSGLYISVRSYEKQSIVHCFDPMLYTAIINHPCLDVFFFLPAIKNGKTGDSLQFTIALLSGNYAWLAGNACIVRWCSEL